MMSLEFGCQSGMNTIALAVSVALVDAIAIALRFYTRRRQTSTFGVDDWWSLASLILLFSLSAILLIAASAQVLSCPAPANEADILASLGSETSHLAWAFYLISCIAVGCVKMTFMFCMRRVFCTRDKAAPFNRLTMAVIALIVLWTLGFVAAMVLINVDWAGEAGNPATWASEPASASTDAMFFALVVSDVVIDGIIMLLPAFVIFTLNLSLGRKLAICGIFLLRLLALAASITRMLYTVKATQLLDALLSVDPKLDSSEDLLTVQNLNTQMIWWTMLEVAFGLLASCATTIQFLLQRKQLLDFFARLARLVGLTESSATDYEKYESGTQSPTPLGGSQKHGKLYSVDTASIISAEYTVGSVRPSLTEAKFSSSVTTTEICSTYSRKDSSASLQYTAEEEQGESARHDEVGHAV